MKKRTFAVCLFVAMTIIPVANASDLSSDRLQKITDFEVCGVSFAVNRRQFLTMFPDAQPMPENTYAPLGVISYIIPGKRCDSIAVQFLDDDLLMLVLFFQPRRVREYGGADALLERATKSFGPPTGHVRERSHWHWDFRAIDRRIVVGGMVGESDLWSFSLCKISLWRIEAKRKKKLDAGF